MSLYASIDTVHGFQTLDLKQSFGDEATNLNHAVEMMKDLGYGARPAYVFEADSIEEADAATESFKVNQKPAGLNCVRL